MSEKNHSVEVTIHPWGYGERGVEVPKGSSREGIPELKPRGE